MCFLFEAAKIEEYFLKIQRYDDKFILNYFEDLIKVAKVAPKINPTAISTTFPFIRKSLNSFNIFFS